MFSYPPPSCRFVPTAATRSPHIVTHAVLCYHSHSCTPFQWASSSPPRRALRLEPAACAGGQGAPSVSRCTWHCALSVLYSWRLDATLWPVFASGCFMSHAAALCGPANSGAECKQPASVLLLGCLGASVYSVTSAFTLPVTCGSTCGTWFGV